MSEKPRLLRIPERFGSAEEVLRCALQLNLPSVVLISECPDGSIVFLGTDSSLAHTNWILDRAKLLLQNHLPMVRVDGKSSR